MHFGGNFLSLPMSGVSFPSSGPRFVDRMDEDQGGMNFIYWSEIHISEGLRFTLLPLIHQFLHFTRLYPVHVHVNIIRVLLVVCVLNRKYEVRLGLEKVLYSYSLTHHNLGKYYLVVDNKALQLVTNLPTISKNKPHGYVLLFVTWGCARDPMVPEFRVTTDPEAGLVLGSKSFSFCLVGLTCHSLDIEGFNRP